MRIRLPMGRSVFFIAALAFALFALLPISLAASWFDLGGRGLAAREADGSLWLGALKEAQFGGIALGDVDARLNILPLLIGRARLSLSRSGDDAAFRGAVSVSRHGVGVDDLTGRLRTGALFAPLPIASFEFDDLSAHFIDGRCDHADGNVRAMLTGEVAGMMLPSGLNGSARCAEGVLLIPLASQTGMEQANLRIMGDGGWRIDLVVRPADPAIIPRLTAAGFAPGAGGYVRRIDGNF